MQSCTKNGAGHPLTLLFCLNLFQFQEFLGEVKTKINVVPRENLPRVIRHLQLWRFGLDTGLGQP